MGRRGGIYFLIAIMIALSAMIATSLREENLETKLLPLVIGGGALFLSVIELLRLYLQGRSHGANSMSAAAGDAEVSGGTPRGYLIAGGWVLVFTLAIYFLGFIIATPLVLVAYMRSYGATWLLGTTSAIVTIAIIYGLFEYLLAIELYRGLLFAWLRG